MGMLIQLGSQSFVGVAEVSGAELEILHRVLGKIKRTDRRYVNGDYFNVYEKAPIKIEVSLMPIGAKFGTEEEYSVERAEEEEKERATKAKQVAAIVTATEQFRECNDYGNAANREPVIKALRDGGHMYYAEKSDPDSTWSVGEDFIMFYVTTSTGKEVMIAVGRDGAVTRS